MVAAGEGGRSFTDGVKNEDVKRQSQAENNALRTLKRRKANGVGHILRRNFFLKRVVEER